MSNFYDQFGAQNTSDYGNNQNGSLLQSVMGFVKPLRDKGMNNAQIEEQARQQVMNMLNSGKISQQTLDQAMEKAKGLQGLLSLMK